MKETCIIVDYAKNYGVERAALIDFFKCKIASLIDPDEDYRQNQECKLTDGRHWVRLSKKEIFEEVKYLKLGTINSSIKYLRNKGVIETRQMSPNGYDRSYWYSFVNEKDVFDDYKNAVSIFDFKDED